MPYKRQTNYQYIPRAMISYGSYQVVVTTAMDMYCIYKTLYNIRSDSYLNFQDLPSGSVKQLG